MNYKVFYLKKGKTVQIKLIAFSIKDAINQMDKLGVNDAQILAIIIIDD